MPPREIFVTNHNDFTHTDLYDGVEYVFPPKERVLIPTAAATHMFGWNMPDKSEVLARLGWTFRQNAAGKIEEDPNGVKKLAKFVFTNTKLVEDKADKAEAPLV